MIKIAARTVTAAALLIGSLISSSCAAQSDASSREHWKWGTIAEVDEREAVLAAVLRAAATEDFAKLDAMEAEYRGAGGSTLSGSSKLELFYAQLADQLGKPNARDGCSPRWTHFMDDWHAASPGTPAQIILGATLLEARAWCFRGSGNADSVAQDAWQPFRDNIAAAVTLLERNKAAASLDPEYYVELESLYIAQARSRDDFQGLVEEASSRYPYYYGIYYAAYRYYQPQWYGSLADIDKLARYTVAKTRERDGTSGYVRVYWNAVLCGCYQDLKAMDWPAMRTAMADLAQRYPVDWTYLHLVQLSCLRGDASEARRYFSELGTNSAESWLKDDWVRCRDLVGPSREAFPQDMP